MTSSPVVSVCMSVYNAERYLPQAMDSVLNQTFEDFEFLILDDGSRDQSSQILLQYAEKDSRIKILNHEGNRGVPKTRNELLAQCQGEYVAVMDADDVAFPDRFEHQVTFLKQNPDVVCVGGTYQFIDEAGRLLLRNFILPQEDQEIQAQLLAGYGGMHHPCLMIRRSAMEQVGGYTETMTNGSDIDLCLKLGEVGKLYNFQKPVLKYRVHAQSLTERNYLRPREEVYAACQRAWLRRGIQGEFKATQPRRPGRDRVSQSESAVLYGWWAFNSQQRWTAFLYGLRAIRLLPFSLEGWRLVICALIKPLPEEQPQ